jgi:hypothetical protein
MIARFDHVSLGALGARDPRSISRMIDGYTIRCRNGLRSLYLTDDEWAAEIANRTMHGVASNYGGSRSLTGSTGRVEP